MDKINPKISGQPKNITSGDSSKLKAQLDQIREKEFGKVLAAELSNPAEAENNSQASAGASGLSEIQSNFTTKLINQTLDQNQIYQQIQTSLDLFERYAAFLGDPDKTLKQSHGILEQIISQTQAISDEIERYESTVSPMANEMKNTLLELMTTARVEQIKFDRGDYT